MRITKPSYYETFRCIAQNCPDSCCKEWEVDVDPETTALYTSLPGKLGEDIRKHLQINPDGSSCITIVNGRCPMWQPDGLCRIQANLGHDALCETCRQFPRISHDYGDFMEYGLELSCPEAARLILRKGALVTQEVPGSSPAEYDLEIMAILLESRRTALAFLDETALSPGEVLAVLLLYGYQVQDALDGGDLTPLDARASLSAAHAHALAGSSRDFQAVFLSLEILNPDWKTRLETTVESKAWSETESALAVYFIQRYWLQAISDFDLVARVKFIVSSCLLIHLLGGDLLHTAQQYSKEIENSWENVDALFDAAYTCPAMTDDKLLGLLLGE